MVLSRCLKITAFMTPSQHGLYHLKFLGTVTLKHLEGMQLKKAIYEINENMKNQASNILTNQLTKLRKRKTCSLMTIEKILPGHPKE